MEAPIIQQGQCCRGQPAVIAWIDTVLSKLTLRHVSVASQSRHSGHVKSENYHGFYAGLAQLEKGGVGVIITVILAAATAAAITTAVVVYS